MSVFTDFCSVSGSNTGRSLIPSGEYICENVSVEWAEEYTKHSAIRMTYKLTDPEDGTTYDFEELFHWKPMRARTKQFMRYIAANGLDEGDPFSFLGAREKITLKRSTKVRAMTIEEREFIEENDARVEA